MNRPSHWILLFSAVLGAVLCWTGDVQRYLLPVESPVAQARSEVSVSARRRPAAMPRHVLAGRVVDRLGWPLPAAEIVVLGADEPAVACDGDGRFELSLGVSSRPSLAIMAPDKRPARLDGWVGTPGLIVLDDATPFDPPLSMAVPKAAGLLGGEGYVRGPGGEKAPFACVVVRETGVEARADESGMYRIPLLPPPAETTLLAFDDQGRAAVSTPVRPTRAQGLMPLPELQLEPTTRIAGYVRDSAGNPSAGVTVVLSGDGSMREALSNEGGYFSFGGLIAMDYALDVRPHRGELGLRMAVQPGNIDLELALTEPRALHVRVVDRAQAPRPRLHVVADESGLRRAYGLTDDRGEVSLTGLGAGPFAFDVRAGDAYAPLDVVDWAADRQVLVVE